ncbi:DUF6519 domain-containing protein [Vitiosangium sp. GDMCC 1.1324]|uniref:DUF6519 domain-containing protein n=1 Tax=Vitiosangium sp. (strain GDMCC 1.1324) TaxID=2138576 RepID=UPI000D370184|nr:DUF6519 domain-containing protein [Vitiosangium sp. GDMCC 1.1324]PTL79528.1 hypothetical protein DAT35_32450 [Vitiosangium sp. GDMCC 1.1324]
MTSDYSRSTFNPRKHYSGVRMQQGRVQLDADWNEQVDIAAHQLRQRTKDLLGPNGAPVDEAGFALEVVEGRLHIGAGRYYVNGVLCENEARVALDAQPDDPGQPQPEEPGVYLALLDLWERTLGANEDPSIREVALGGPDTAVRTKTVWQVRTLRVDGDPDAPDRGREDRAWKHYLSRHAHGGGLKAWREKDEATELPGNQLYRVEVHDEGERAGMPEEAHGAWPRPRVESAADDRQLLRLHEEEPWDARLWREGRPVEVLTENGRHLTRLLSVDAETKELRLAAPVPEEQGEPRRIKPIAGYKWSRNNGIDALPVALVRREEQHVVVRLASPVGTRGVELRVGDVVEAVDERTVLRGEPAPLRRVVRISQDRREVTLDGDVPTNFAATPEKTKPLLRRWDRTPATREPGSLPVVDGKLELEHGVHVEFTGLGGYRAGDSWLIPARTRTGTVEWPTDEHGQPRAQHPHEGNHHYTLLAVVRVEAEGVVRVEDRRVLFAPLTRAGQGPGHEGPTTLRGNLHVIGSAIIDGTLDAGSIQGQLAHETVGTHQLKEKAVTSRKLADASVHPVHLAPEVGLVPVGFSILGESPQPPAGYESSHLSVEVFNHRARWVTRTPVPVGATARVVLVTLEGVPHALLDGGQVLRLEEKDATWKQVTQLPVPQTGFGAAVLEGRLHVIGGKDENGRPLAHHVAWDAKADRWTTLSPMPTARTEPGVVSADGWLFVLGGLECWPLPWWTGESKLPRPALLSRLQHSSAEAAVYDTRKDTWLQASDLTSRRSRFGVAVVRGRIHVVGGERKRLLLPARPVAKHEQFDPNHNRWSSLAPLRRERAEAAVAAVDERLYVVGGKDGDDLLADVERYSFTSDAWLPQEELATPVKGAGATVAGGELLVTGGTGPTGPLATSQGLEVASLLYVHRKRAARAAEQPAQPTQPTSQPGTTSTTEPTSTTGSTPTTEPTTQPVPMPVPPIAARTNEHRPRFRPPRFEPAPTVAQRVVKLALPVAGLAAILVAVGALWPKSSQPSQPSQPTQPQKPPSPAEAVMGLDVSHYQGQVDWSAVLKEGAVDFAFVKATEGLGLVDPQFTHNRTTLEGTPLRWSAYHYYRPEHSAKEQAEFFLNTVGVDKLKNHRLPPVLDVEEWSEVSTQGLINGVQTWLDTVEAAIGRKPIVYTYHEFWTKHLNRGFQSYPLWLSGPLDEAVEWSFWQVGDQGKVAGVTGCVDQDMFRGTVEELDAFVTTGAVPATAMHPPMTSAQCTVPAADAGTHDAGTHDAGRPDAGKPDAGKPSSKPDAGTRDAGTPDAGTPDTGESGPREFQTWMKPNPARRRSGPSLVIPPLATRVGVWGNTTVRCTLQKTGTLKDCIIIQPLGPSSQQVYREVDEAVLDMLNASKYEPETANGEVVDVYYDFKLSIDARSGTWSIL